MKMSSYIFVIATAVSVLIGCTNSGNTNSDIVAQDTVLPLISQAQADSLARSLGFIQGSDVNYEKMEMEMLDSVMTLWADSSFLRGFETALGADVAASGYTQGVRAAREIIFKIEELKSYGIDINREMLLAALERQFAADTVTSTHLQELNRIYNQLLKHAYSQPNQ